MKTIDVVAASDFHGVLPRPERIPACDLLILAGDLSDASSSTRWWEENMRPFLERVKAKEVVGIAGNFDHLATTPAGVDYLRTLPWEYLHDESVVLPESGLRVHGSPWAGPHGNWPFCAPDSELEEKWKLIHPHTEVLVVHGPPKGVFDKVAFPSADDPDQDGHVGSRSLFWKIDELAQRRLRLAVWGHIHEARGIRFLPTLTLVNAASFHQEPYRFTIKGV
jgi:Icc-related predicted phosphoesterase